MDIAVDVVAILLLIIAITLGIRKPDLSNPLRTFLFILDVLLAGVIVVRHGWLGFWLVLAAVLLALLSWTVVKVIRIDSLLTKAAVEGDIRRQEMKALYKKLRLEHESIRILSPIESAKLVKALAQRARSPEEIEELTVLVSQLHFRSEYSLEELAERFDRLLRLAGKNVSEARDVADMLSRSTQLAAATFDEMLDALITFYEPGLADDSDHPREEDDSAMGDPFWDALRANTEIQVQLSGRQGVRLRGGPMDGWLVTSDASVFAPDWYKTWPPGVAKKNSPGRYELSESGTWAEWVLLEDE